MMIHHSRYDRFIDYDDKPAYPKFDATQSCFGTATNYFYFNHKDGDEQFIEDDDTHFQTAHIEYVKRVCDNCSFLDSCFAWAVKHEEYGIWAGTSPPEREAIRKEYGIVYDGLYYNDKKLQNTNRKEESMPNYTISVSITVDAANAIEAFDSISSIVEDFGGRIKLSPDVESALFEEMGISYDWN